MRRSTSFVGLIAGSVLTVATLAPVTANAAQTIDWLNMSPVAFGSTVPSNSNFNLPGVGLVNITYSLPAVFTQSRFTNPILANGNVSAGAYNWTAHELIGVVNTVSANTTTQWHVTYTFPSLQAANSIYVGISGLGRTTNNGGMMTLATVNQNGTFLGDWISGGNYGPTQYTGGAGFFTMNNSLTGPGGLDPWWNTELGVVQINDAVSTLTVIFDHVPGDGVGVNIGFVPTPGTAAVLGLAGLMGAGRRRR